MESTNMPSIQEKANALDWLSENIWHMSIANKYCIWELEEHSGLRVTDKDLLTAIRKFAVLCEKQDTYFSETMTDFERGMEQDPHAEAWRFIFSTVAWNYPKAHAIVTMMAVDERKSLGEGVVRFLSYILDAIGDQIRNTDEGEEATFISMERLNAIGKKAHIDPETALYPLINGEYIRVENKELDDTRKKNRQGKVFNMGQRLLNLINTYKDKTFSAQEDEDAYRRYTG